MQDDAAIGLRERKLRETRHALESATVDLVLELGLEHVTIEQIAERADVSPRTFFNYFGSKEDALLGVAVREPQESLFHGFPDEPSGAGVYEDLKHFLIHGFGRRLASDGLLRKRIAALKASPQLAGRQSATLHLTLDGLTRRVTALLAMEAGLPPEEPNPELDLEAQMLIRICANAFMHAFDPFRLNEEQDEGFGALPQAFELLERTAARHLPGNVPSNRPSQPSPLPGPLGSPKESEPAS